MTFVAFLTCAAPLNAHLPLAMRADETPASGLADDATERSALHAVYVQVDGVLLGLLNTGSVSVNDERRFGERFALHGGLGYASWGELPGGSGAQAVALELEAKLIAGGRNHSPISHVTRCGRGI
jgi:hypothetical protein